MTKDFSVPALAEEIALRASVLEKAKADIDQGYKEGVCNLRCERTDEMCSGCDCWKATRARCT